MPVTLEELLAGRRLEDLPDAELQELIIQVRQQRRSIRTPAPKKQRAAKPKAAAPAVDKAAMLAFIEEQMKKLKGESSDA